MKEKLSLEQEIILCVEVQAMLNHFNSVYLNLSSALHSRIFFLYKIPLPAINVYVNFDHFLDTYFQEEAHSFMNRFISKFI